MPLPFQLDRRSRTPLQRQLYEAVRQTVIDGHVRPGDRMPATRELAKALDVSRITVSLAYDQLTAEGFLDPRRGAGTFVSTQIPDLPGHPWAAAASAPVREIPLRVSRYAARLPEEPPVAPAPSSNRVIDLSSFAPDFERFPQTDWRRALTRRLRRSGRILFEYAPDANGYEPLRAAIARYVARSRAIQCTAADVVIVSGSQQALDLCARVLTDPGDRVAIEDPGYPGVRDLFRAHGARVHTVPVDRAGISIRQLKQAARIVFTTPSHQFPTGASMSLPRRMELLAWARTHGAAIIEDDYDSEYRYRGAPLPALRSLAADVPVVYIGTFSKVMYPGIRLGYLIATPALARRFAAVKRMMDRHTSLLEQMALADFIGEQHLERHVRRMRRLYHQRRSALLAALHQHFGAGVEVRGDEAGMHVLVRFTHGAREPDPSRDGVRLMSAAKYYAASAPAGEFVLGFTAVSERALREGVARLKRAWS